MTRVVLVCMLDSIHSARWLSQFRGKDLEFRLIASRKHRAVHSDLQKLLDDYPKNFKIVGPIRISKRLGPYLDFTLFELCGRYIPQFKRGRFLREKVKQLEPDFLHLLEIQSAGYLYLDSKLVRSKKMRVILTNWGSDIYYFSNFEDHKIKISHLLTQVDSYAAECRRDYNLAGELGFLGENLPLIPNSGGFSNLDLN